MICECCLTIKGVEVQALHWMEWNEWLCSECASEAIEDDSRRDLNEGD